MVTTFNPFRMEEEAEEDHLIEEGGDLSSCVVVEHVRDHHL